MALASTSLVQIRYIPEVTAGTTPTSGADHYDLRVTGESFDFAIQKEISKEINSTRTTSSEVPVAASSTGGFQSELSYAEYDRLLASLMQSTWTVYGTNGVQGTASTVTATATTFTAGSATAGADSWATLQKGQWFMVTWPSTAYDGKLFRVSTVTAPTTTVITLDTNTPAGTLSATAGFLVKTSRLTHGTTQTSFSFERYAADVTQYMIYRGMTPSKLTLNAASGSLTTMSMDFMGLSMARGATTFLGTTTNVPSQTYDIHSAVSNSQSLIWEGGAPAAGTYVKSLSLEFDNALRQQNAIGSLAPVAIASGTIAAKATLSVYFANGDLFDKFLDNDSTQIHWASLDPDGNGYVFTMGHVNISSFKITAGSKDQDLMAEVTMTPLRDAENATAALRKVLIIDRVGAAVA